jgi:hypothetical protein
VNQRYIKDSIVKFESGRIVSTPRALQAMEDAGENPSSFLARHIAGDWGELDADDVKENEFSLSHGLRLLSAYRLRTGVKIWIITESDRSATTFLLPEEY